MFDNLVALLEYQFAMGVDEAIEEKPVKRAGVVKKLEPEVSKPREVNILPTNIEKTSFTISPATEIKYPAETEKLAREQAESAKTLEELKQSVMGFKHLSICRTATNTVFADGTPEAPIMFIGEAPGENEDLKGIPFCGDSGQLLDELLRWAGITRDKNMYITNTVFWRPPGNRKPTPEELAACRPFVEKHIALIRPKYLILVGGTATLSMLGVSTGITKLRKEKHTYTNKYLDYEIRTSAVFHPSYLLRSPLNKRTFWLDVLTIRKELRAMGVKV